MTKWMFACAVVTLAGFLTEQAPAQEPVKSPPTVITSTESITTTPRTGLFGRLRERRQMTTVVQPIMQAETIATPSPIKQAQATEPATPVPMQTVQMQQVVEPRQGLLARLRGRLGR